jgi:hypothetical protein
MVRRQAKSEVAITFNLSVPSINRYLLLTTTDENGGVTLPVGYDGIGGAMAHSLLRVCFNTCFSMVFQHGVSGFNTNISAFILINSA